MLIGATLGRYFSLRFLRTIMLVFGTVFALVYTIDFVELMGMLSAWLLKHFFSAAVSILSLSCVLVPCRLT